MAILKEKQTWQRPKAKRSVRPGTLTKEETENVRAALRVLSIRHGSNTSLAKAMGTNRKCIVRWVSPQGKPTAVTALAVARLADVSVDDVLTGAFPEPGACPLCGRNDKNHPG